MIREVRDGFKDAVEKSGKPLTVDPFFMALLLAQQRIINSLVSELKARGVNVPLSVSPDERTEQLRLS